MNLAQIEFAATLASREAITESSYSIMLLETGSFIQELTPRFADQERSMVIYTTKNANEARMLAAELEGLLRRLIPAAGPDAIA